MSEEPGRAIKSLYERAAEGSATRPDVPPAELGAVTWMVGTWAVHFKAYATARTPERVAHGERVTTLDLDGSWLTSRDTFSSQHALEHFTYSAMSRVWVMDYIDYEGNWGALTSPEWEGDTLSLMGTVALMGEQVRLRQRLTKISDNEYQVIFEEQQAAGEWLPVDEYGYARKPG